MENSKDVILVIGIYITLRLMEILQLHFVFVVTYTAPAHWITSIGRWVYPLDFI